VPIVQIAVSSDALTEQQILDYSRVSSSAARHRAGAVPQPWGASSAR
jgi:hypothetical protein